MQCGGSRHSLSATMMCDEMFVVGDCVIDCCQKVSYVDKTQCNWMTSAVYLIYLLTITD